MAASLTATPKALVAELQRQESTSRRSAARRATATSGHGERARRPLRRLVHRGGGGAVRRPGAPAGRALEVQDAGDTFNGKYRITSAKHVFNSDVRYQTVMRFSGIQDRSLLGLVSNGNGSGPISPDAEDRRRRLGDRHERGGRREARPREAQVPLARRHRRDRVGAGRPAGRGAELRRDDRPRGERRGPRRLRAGRLPPPVRHRRRLQRHGQAAGRDLRRRRREQRQGQDAAGTPRGSATRSSSTTTTTSRGSTCSPPTRTSRSTSTRRTRRSRSTPRAARSRSTARRTSP